MHCALDVKARPRDRCRCSNAPVFGTEAPWLSGCLLSSEVLVRFQPVPPSAVISGETMIGRANPAPVRSLGANERRVRFPPLRPHHRSTEGTQGCEACWLRFESSRWYPAGRWRSVIGLLILCDPCLSPPSGSRDSLRRAAGRSRCVIQTTTAARRFVRLYIARAGARPRVQIESGGVRLLGGVLRPRVARAAVWQQSRWVMPSLSARHLFRGVAQIGRALGSGPRGRWFKSIYPDGRRSSAWESANTLVASRPETGR